MDIRRVGIADQIGSVLTPDEHALVGLVSNLSAVRAVALSLDQVVNRSAHEAQTQDRISPETAAANADDFVQVAKQIRILEAGATVGRQMLAAIQGQLGVTPPAAAPRRPTK